MTYLPMYRKAFGHSLTGGLRRSRLRRISANVQRSLQGRWSAKVSCSTLLIYVWEILDLNQ